jgi:hypothetical protein
MYYCNQHIPADWHLSWLETGNFMGASHAAFREAHTGTMPSKPQNGFFFFGDDANRYQAFQQSFAAPDFVHSVSGRISAINVFDAPIGTVETRGVSICTTRTGMAVLTNFPDVTHGFPYRHTGDAISCSVCGSSLNQQSGRSLP